jgi:hypothetical protein
MATVVQNLDYVAAVFPYRQDIGFESNAGYQGAVPFGQAIVNEEFTLDSVGVGDVGSAMIGVKLPNNYCAMLRSVHLNAHSDVPTVYDDAVMGLAYQNPGGPYKNSMTELPIDEYLFWSMVQTEKQSIYYTGANKYFNNWAIGSKHANTTAQTNPPGADSPLNVPLWVSPNYPGDTALIILNAGATSSTTPCRFNMTFDIYTFEAAYAAGVMSNPRTTST